MTSRPPTPSRRGSTRLLSTPPVRPEATSATTKTAATSSRPPPGGSNAASTASLRGTPNSRSRSCRGGLACDVVGASTTQRARHRRARATCAPSSPMASSPCSRTTTAAAQTEPRPTSTTTSSSACCAAASRASSRRCSKSHGDDDIRQRMASSRSCATASTGRRARTGRKVVGLHLRQPAGSRHDLRGLRPPSVLPPTPGLPRAREQGPLHDGRRRSRKPAW